MYLTISPQKLSQNFSQSVRDFVSYLEKENEGKNPEEKELFFNQYDSDIHPSVVTQEIDANGGKLKKTEPKYYSITINPSKYELKHIGNNHIIQTENIYTLTDKGMLYADGIAADLFFV